MNDIKSKNVYLSKGSVKTKCNVTFETRVLESSPSWLLFELRLANTAQYRVSRTQPLGDKAFYFCAFMNRQPTSLSNMLSFVY